MHCRLIYAGLEWTKERSMYWPENTVMTSREKTSPLFSHIVFFATPFTNGLSLTNIISSYFQFSDMLPGLREGQVKMSKSEPSSAIYMEDEVVLCYIFKNFEIFFTKHTQ
jgi:hypothetical protein